MFDSTIDGRQDPARDQRRHGLSEQPPFVPRQGPQSPWFAVKMHSHSSHHVSIDLMEPAIPMKDPGMWFLHGGEGIQGSDSHVSQAEVQEPKESSGILCSLQCIFE